MRHRSPCHLRPRRPAASLAALFFLLVWMAGSSPVTAAGPMFSIQPIRLPVRFPAPAAPLSPDQQHRIHLPILLRSEHRPLSPPRLLTASPSPTASRTPRPSPSPSPTPADPTDRLFDPRRVLDLRLTLAPADWERLRYEARTLGGLFGPEPCPVEPRSSPYTEFEARLTLDGQTLERVGLRKKGLLGSVDATKPSLKLDLDAYVPGQTLWGMSRLTLNNAIVDPAYMRQCLVYGRYAAAGLPAPRCNFARVRVNGRDMGLYVHVESIKKPFIGRHFADDEGALYEGSRSDFAPHWIETFELKSNAPAAEADDLSAISTALKLPDEALLDALEAEIDLEAFFRYWALEILVGQWDGYANNHNNFYLYRDPTSDRAHFIPWGVDGAMRNNFLPAGGGQAPPTSMAARGLLSRRLYLHPEGRRRYIAAMRKLLTTVWDEESLQIEMDGYADRLRPHLAGNARSNFDGELQRLRQWVDARRGQIQRELVGDGPAWTFAFDSACRRPIGSLRASFKTRWGQGFEGGASMQLELAGREIELIDVQAAAGYDIMRAWPRHPTLQISGALPVETNIWRRGERVLVLLFVDPQSYAAGAQLPVDGNQAFAWVYRQPGRNDNVLPGLLWDGELRLDTAGLAAGDWVAGEVESGLWLWRVDPMGEGIW
jgi:hypothetical protein